MKLSAVTLIFFTLLIRLRIKAHCVVLPGECKDEYTVDDLMPNEDVCCSAASVAD